MVSLPSNRLTRIGFRRDVRLFLTALVSFLVCLVVVLLLLLQRFAERIESANFARWNAVANFGAEELSRLDPKSAAAADAALLSVRARYDIAAAELRARGDARPVVSGFPNAELEALKRDVKGGQAIFYFDTTELRAHRRAFQLVAIISIVSTIGGTILLLLYLPKIIDPIEKLLDHAQEVEPSPHVGDETGYLIDTFRNTISTLRQQETELKRLHAAEKNRADELQLISATLTRSLGSGFLAINPAGEIAEINAAGCEILRLRSDESYAGRAVHDVLGDTALARLLESSAAEQRPVTRQEVIIESMSGPVEIGLTTVPLVDEPGDSLGILALFTDLTPIRQLETRLRDLQTLADLGEISAGIAHEFRNSLSTVLGYLKLARRSELPAEAEAKIVGAENEALVLADAVTALLNFAKPLQVERNEVDLDELARAVTERLQAGAPDIELRYQGEPALIDGDRNLLVRAVENVVRNAIDAVREKGSGTIDVRVTAGAEPRLSVTDTGIGIDPAEAARLFLPFQSDKTTGFGLGLPLTRKIVLLHEGSIELTGERGEWAAVAMTFPPRPLQS